MLYFIGLPIWLWLAFGGGGLWWWKHKKPSIPDNLPDWRPAMAQAASGGKGYTVTQADLDAVDASHFAPNNPPAWLVPRVGTVIPAELLGPDDSFIPGTMIKWKATGGPKDGTCPPLWRPIAQISARILEVIQAAAGTPIKVSSWWRGPKSSQSTDQGEYARRGGWGGYHPVAAAMDMYAPAWVEQYGQATAKQKLYDVVQALITAGKIPEGGLGIYGEKYKIIHYDPRSVLTGKRGSKWKKARWDRRPDPITGKVNKSGE